MLRLDSSSIIAEFADRECKHLDLVASWESLCNAYQVMGFTDEITDEQRLAEFKHVIKEVNRFLTRSRQNLMTAKDIDAAIEYLQSQWPANDQKIINSRQALTYYKLKQQWIGTAINKLSEIKMQTESEEVDDWQ